MNHLSFKRCALILVTFVAVANVNHLSAQTSDASPVRTWHASTGGFKVEAELVDVREGKVQLKKSDGALMWVPLDKLSLADVKYVNAELAKARQAIDLSPIPKPAATAPAAVKPSAKKPADAAAEKEAEPAADAEMEADADSDDADMQADSDMEESTDADGGAAAGKGSKGAPRSPFAGMRDSNLVLGQVSTHDVVFPSMPSAWVAVRRHAAGGQQYSVGNIRTGKSNSPFVTEGHASVTALSPDGATLAISSGFGGKISIYSTTTGKKTKDLEVSANNHISMMMFVSTTQLLTNGGFQMPANVFDVKTGKVVKTMDVDGQSWRKPAVSPDGKWLAVPGNSLVLLYDLKSGKLKSQLPVVPEKGKGNTMSSINIEDVAFCSDGTELAVLGSGKAGEFQIFSVKSGRPIIKHLLSERISSFASSSQYLGPAVESIPGNKGYIIYGCAIVDRENGGPIWVDKPGPGEQASSYRVLIDDQRQLRLTGNYNNVRFEVVKLPWSDISKSKDLVAKGGTVEDAGLPAVKPANSSAAKSMDGTLNPKPFQGKKIDSEVATNPKPIPIDRSFGYIQQVKFASPKSGVCVTMPSIIGLAGVSGKNPNAMVIDLKKGEVQKSVDVGLLSQVKDVSPDGKWLVGTTGTNNDRVDVYNLAAGKHELGFRPSVESNYGSSLTGVHFVADDVLITIATTQATAWSFPELKALYKFSTLGSVFRFPSSPLFLHRNDQSWYVRNARDGRVEGTLDNSSALNAEFARYVHFRADESAAAAILGYDRDQRLVVWDLLTGKRTHNIPLNNFASSRVALAIDSKGRLTFRDAPSRQQLEEVSIPMTDSVIWTGDNQLLMRWMRNDKERFNREADVSQIVYSLFNLDDGRMLWDYRVPMGALVEGGPEGQLWFVETNARQQSLVGFKAPTKEAMLKIASAPAPKLLIAKGDAIMVDMQVTISGDKLADGVLRDQVVAALVKNLAIHDVDVSERAGIKLTILVDQIVTNNGRGNESPKLRVVARLTDISNNLLWQRERVIDSQKTDNGKQILAENLRKQQWEDTLSWIRETVEPKEMFEKWYYRGIGESLLTSDGEKIVEMKTN